MRNICWTGIVWIELIIALRNSVTPRAHLWQKVLSTCEPVYAVRQHDGSGKLDGSGKGQLQFKNNYGDFRADQGKYFTLTEVSR